MKITGHRTLTCCPYFSYGTSHTIFSYCAFDALLLTSCTYAAHLITRVSQHLWYLSFYDKKSAISHIKDLICRKDLLIQCALNVDAFFLKEFNHLIH